MCGRYYIDAEARELGRILREAEQGPGGSMAQATMKVGEIFPTNIVPVLGAHGAALMKWGYSGYKNRVINARSETAIEKPMFRKSLLERRCLIPASGYFEWQRTPSGGKTKQKYALYRPDKSICMAGLWRQEQGEELPVFVILTREAGAGIAHIHDRMPVILPEALWSPWVSAAADPVRLMEQAIQTVAFRAV